ncbi:MAG: prepilin peptidase [Oscillospiraceae bacterium]|nr:prepilin peptidase [Oscillospiraceae bacterium]
MIKKLLPYIGIPIITAGYLLVRANTEGAFTAVKDVQLLGMGYAAAWSDWSTRKVPNKLVAVMFLLWVLSMAVYVFIDIDSATAILLPSIIGGAAGGGLFVVLYLVSHKGVGGADVKFITIAGLYLTFVRLMPALFISSLLAALVSAVLLITKRATRKSSIPLIPFLYTGIIVTIFI